VTRWEHQDGLDDMQVQLKQRPMPCRSAVARSGIHSGSSSPGWGATHFLTKGLERVKTEMSLHVLAYNVKRLITLFGVTGMMEAIRAYALLLALQRVFGASTLLIRSISQRTRRRSLRTSNSLTTYIGGCNSAAKACFEVFTQPGSIADVHGRSLAAKMATVFPDGLMPWPKHFSRRPLVACSSSSS